MICNLLMVTLNPTHSLTRLLLLNLFGLIYLEIIVIIIIIIGVVIIFMYFVYNLASINVCTPFWTSGQKSQTTNWLWVLAVCVCELGMSASRSLNIINNDNEAFTFNVVESSLYSAGCADHVVITPMSATIPPHSRSLTVTVTVMMVNGKYYLLQQFYLVFYFRFFFFYFFFVIFFVICVCYTCALVKSLLC